MDEQPDETSEDARAGLPWPYPDQLPDRSMLDAGRPWLEAGRSWRSRSDQLNTYLEHQRGHRRRAWERRDREVVDLELRATACASHALAVDRATASGWVVWHDRVVAGTRDVVDHVMVGPAGVVLVQSLPGLDHDKSPVHGRVPGPRTRASVPISWQLLNDTIGPTVAAALAEMMPEWTIPVRWTHVLVDEHVRTQFTDVYRPEQVGPFIADHSAIFGPLHVHDIASRVETILPPAPLGDHS